MGTKRRTTLEISCDICGAKEIVSEYQERTIDETPCATREIGYLDEYGKFHEKKEDLEIKFLELCPKCKEKSFSEIIGVTTQMFTQDCSYRFLKLEDN